MSEKLASQYELSDDMTIKELIKQEYKKCANDIIYFCKKYMYIQHPHRGKIKFNLYPFQEKVLREVETNNYNLILKARQLGISTLSAAITLHMMIFRQNVNILVIATKQDVAKNLVSKVRFAYENLPTWLKEPFKENNKLSLVLKNGSQVKATTSAGDAGRSEAVTMLVVDEAAFIKDIGDIWASIQPTLSTGGKSIVLSCVTKDTFIFTDNGIQTINDFINLNKMGGYEIDKYNILGFGKKRSGNLFFNNGKVNTKIIKTKHSEIEGSLNHKLWAYKMSESKFDWYELKDLNVNDYISIQYGNDIWGNNDNVNCSYTLSKKIKNSFNIKKINKYISYLMGLYISEGCYKKIQNKDGNIIGGSLTISCGDDISWIFKKLNLPFYTDGIHYTISSKNLIEFFDYIGFDESTKSNNKYIPNRLLSVSKENMIWLLKGIFDGDGGSIKKSINYTTSSEKLANQIRIILLNFGILTSKILYKKENLNLYDSVKNKFNNDIFKLEIYGKNCIKFYEIIGFNLKRKQNNYNILKESNFNRNSNNYIIPNSNKLLKELYDLSNETTWSLNKKYKLNLNNQLNKKNKYNKFISKDIMIKMYNLFSHLLSPKKKEYWDKVISENIVWVPIKNIIDSQNETYDFSLPNNNDDFWSHSIIYNGIIGHQTPNGMGNWFHRQWVDAKAKKNNFNTIKLHWSMHPERNQEWRDEQDIILGSRMASQECFDGNTRIYTKNGLKKISDINVGDVVLTHTGEFKKVIRTYSHYENKLYEIYSFNNRIKRYVTKNHPFLTLNNKWIELKYIKNEQILKCFPKNVNKEYLNKFKIKKTETDKIYINESDKKMLVYNLEIEDNNSYVTEHFVVHNCDGDFLSSGATFIEPNILKFYNDTFIKDPIEERGIHRNLWVWEMPDYKKQYLISADVARGDGTDYSACHVIDIENMTQVAEFESKLPTDEFGNFLVGLASEYNDALLVVENANSGWAVLQKIIDRGYKNLYYTEQKNLSYVDKTKHTNKLNALEKKSVPGFTTSMTTRPIILNRLEEYFRHNEFILQSKRTLNELYSFVWNANRPEAQSGYNDDLVMALAIGLWVRDTAIHLNKLRLQSTQANLDGFHVSTDHYDPKSMIQHGHKEQWNMPLDDQNSENITWLL